MAPCSYHDCCKLVQLLNTEGVMTDTSKFNVLTNMVTETQYTSFIYFHICRCTLSELFCDRVGRYSTPAPLVMATHYKNIINSELGKHNSNFLLLF